MVFTKGTTQLSGFLIFNFIRKTFNVTMVMLLYARTFSSMYMILNFRSMSFLLVAYNFVSFSRTF